MNKHLFALTIALLTGTSLMVSQALAAEISPEIPAAILPELLSPAPAKPTGEPKPDTGKAAEKHEPGTPAQKPAESKPAESTPIDQGAARNKAAGDKSAEQKPIEPAESKPAGNKQDQKAVQQVDDLDDDGEPPHVIRCLDLKGAFKIKCLGDKGVRKLGAGVRAVIQQQ